MTVLRGELREYGIKELQDISHKRRQSATVERHVVHYFSNNKLCLSCTRWIETPGVRLSGYTADKKQKKNETLIVYLQLQVQAKGQVRINRALTWESETTHHLFSVLQRCS